MATKHNVEDRVTNSCDIIDSRDVIKRIDELESELSVVDCHKCGGSGTLAAPDTDAGEEGEPVACVHCHREGTIDCSLYGS